MSIFPGMNTSFLLAGLNQSDSSTVQALVLKAESTFSRFNAESEITKINQLAGQWVNISPQTFTLLEDSVSAYKETEGLFNPFLGETMHVLGYNRSFETLPLAKIPPQMAKKFHCASPKIEPLQTDITVHLEFDKERGMVRLSDVVALDLGGIAKGWIAQYACNQLQLKGVNNGLIDAGGDIILWGHDHLDKEWGIGVAHPLDPNIEIASLWFDKMTAIATSSTIKRRWQQPNTCIVHHIVDPRTRLPSASDLIQVTVLARDLIIAEQYTKCLLILGSRTGFPWIQNKRPDVAYLAVRNDGSILTSENLRWYCTDLEVMTYA